MQKTITSSLISSDPAGQRMFGADGFYAVAGDHNEIQFQPEKYARAIDEILTALNRKTGNTTILPAED